MKKLIYLSVLVVTVAFGCKAQKTEERQATAFTKIKLSGSVKLIYTSSDTLSLKVEAKENELKNVETRVENGTLFVSNKGNFSGDVTVYVRNNKLDNIEASGATNFRISNTLKTDTLNLNLSGASDLRGKIEVKKLNCIQSGASSMALSGEGENLSLVASGASSFKGYELLAKNADVVASGASNVRVNVNGKLRANASGASDIKVKGDPTDVNAEASTSANIRKVTNAGKDEGGKDSDTTSYNWKKKKILVINGMGDRDYENEHEKSSFKHWKGFSLGVNGYMNATGGTNMLRPNQYMELNYPSSFNLQLNLAEKHLNIVKNNFKLVTGFGFDWHIYDFANRTNLNPDSSYTFGKIDSSNTFGYKRNNLRATYLQVALLFEFNTSNDPNKTFHFAVGVIGQYLIGARTKQKLEVNKYDLTKLRRDNYNLSPFAAKAHVNFGYRGWTVFGEYSLTQLFQSGRGPELYPFTAGIRVVPFG